MAELSSKKLVDVLGEDFEIDYGKSIGAVHSGHGVIFGRFGATEVAAKPFRGRRALDKAKHELTMTNMVQELGLPTLQPIKIIETPGLAVLLTDYIRGVIGGNGLSLELSQTSPRGQQTARAVTGMTETLADMHNLDVTHGDPQGKNFGFQMAKMAVGARVEPIIFDLEKATRHGQNSPFRQSATERDLKRLTFTLGSRIYGGDNNKAAEATLIETVLDPYISRREESGECPDNLGSIFEAAVDNFRTTRLRYLGNNAIAVSSVMTLPAIPAV